MQDQNKPALDAEGIRNRVREGDYSPVTAMIEQTRRNIEVLSNICRSIMHDIDENVTVPRKDDCESVSSFKKEIRDHVVQTEKNVSQALSENFRVLGKLTQFVGEVVSK